MAENPQKFKDRIGGRETGVDYAEFKLIAGKLLTGVVR